MAAQEPPEIHLAHQFGSPFSTLGVTMALRSANGSFSSSSAYESSSESSCRGGGARGLGVCDDGLDMADGRGGAIGRAGGGGLRLMLRPTISGTGLLGDAGSFLFSCCFGLHISFLVPVESQYAVTYCGTRVPALLVRRPSHYRHRSSGQAARTSSEP